MHVFAWGMTSAIFIVDLVIRIGLSLRVIMRKRAPSTSIAWLVIILLFPFAGSITYLLLGETRLGERRAARLIKTRPLLRQWTQSLHSRDSIDWESVNPECLPLDHQIRTATGIPTMGGNHLELIENAESFFNRLIEDINHATRSCFLEFYILKHGGRVDDVLEALRQAQARGVQCRLLLDSIGSKDFLHHALAKELIKDGIEIIEALPAGLIRALFVRIDLRNHRKIALIDGNTAYTGSQNLVDPRYFKQGAGVGQWVDVMARVTGPVTELLQVTFAFDVLLELGTHPTDANNLINVQPVSPTGNAFIQLAPSGPGYGEDTIHNLLLTTIYAARHKIMFTTPYFVPDQALVAALKSAAQRGVEVVVIVPARNDSHLVQYASRARYDSLMQAGVHIMAFNGGLLHAKTITVDNSFCLFGSVNLDMRSFWLNFEMTLFVYNKEFTEQVKALQERYLQQTTTYDTRQFQHRSNWERFLENIALLVSPLL